MTLGEKLKEYRAEHGLRQRQLAEMLETAPTNIAAIEVNKRRWFNSPQVMKNVTTLLNTTEEELRRECRQPRRDDQDIIWRFFCNIEYLRRQRGVSKRRVGLALFPNCSDYYYLLFSRWVMPRSFTIQKFSEYYGVPAEVLCYKQLFPDGFQLKQERPKKQPKPKKKTSAKIDKTVGANIRRMREARRWSITGFAIRVDAEENDVKRWEQGFLPNEEQLEAIIEEFGCEMEDLKAEVTK